MKWMQQKDENRGGLGVIEENEINGSELSLKGKTYLREGG